MVILVDGVCTVANCVGKELAPHVKKHGSKLVPESLKKDRNGKSTLDGAMVVAASSVQGNIKLWKLRKVCLPRVDFIYFWLYFQDSQLSGKDWNVQLNALLTMFQQKLYKLSDTSKLNFIILIMRSHSICLTLGTIKMIVYLFFIKYLVKQFFSLAISK